MKKKKKTKKNKGKELTDNNQPEEWHKKKETRAVWKAKSRRAVFWYCLLFGLMTWTIAHSSLTL